MEKKEEIEVEKLVLERGEYVKGAVDRWFDKIPKEKLDRPVIAAFGQEIKPITYTPKELYEELKKQIEERKLSKEREEFLAEIIKKYGEVEK
jgi:hypothetical protein